MRNKKRILALLLAGVLAFGGLPITASAANNVRDGARPANGTTVSQPFPENYFWESTIPQTVIPDSVFRH